MRGRPVELRIIRLVVTILFMASVTMTAVTLAGWKGWLIGAVLFGAMGIFLWRGEADAEADVRVIRAQANSRPDRTTPPPDPRGGGVFDPTSPWQ